MHRFRFILPALLAYMLLSMPLYAIFDFMPLCLSLPPRHRQPFDDMMWFSIISIAPFWKIFWWGFYAAARRKYTRAFRRAVATYTPHAYRFLSLSSHATAFLRISFVIYIDSFRYNTSLLPRTYYQWRAFRQADNKYVTFILPPTLWLSPPPLL